MAQVRQLRARARQFNARLRDLNQPRLRFKVRVLRWARSNRGLERSLELVVRPEQGLDNLIEPIARLVGVGRWREIQSVDDALTKLESVIQRYLSGERPPWEEPM